MGAPLVNIALGVACIVGGATGRLSLLGTHSAPALMLAGAVAVAIGVYQIWRRQGR